MVFNGVTYNIPAYNDTGYAQGTGNLSSYLIALAGGSFPFTSQTANPATAGVIRLANTDTIDWRNFANSGNDVLAVNSSDQLTFNGTPLATNGGGTVNSGSQYQLGYYATAGTAISGNPNTMATTQALVTDSHGVPTTTGNGGTTAIEIGYVHGVTSALQTQINNIGTVNSGTTTHLAYYATSTNAVSNSNPLTISSNTFSISGTNATETISTGDTSTATLTLSSTAYQTSLQALNTGFTLLHDDTNSTNILVYQASDKSVAIHGTNTGSSASSGFVGEWIGSSQDFITSWPGSTGVVTDMTSISLTAGDWDVSLTTYVNANGATTGAAEMFIGTVAGNNLTGEHLPDNAAVIPVGFTQGTMCVPSYRMSLSSTTIVYAKMRITFSAATPAYGTRISARRMR